MAGEGWISVTVAHVEGAMSPAMAAAYQAWLVMFPGRVGRLAELVSQVVKEFRAAVRANPANELDPDETAIPLACLRHCETLILSQLNIEMGRVMNDGEVTLAVRAEVYLRQLMVLRWPFMPAEAETRGMPDYTTQAPREERTL